MSSRIKIVAETGAAHGRSYARCMAMIHHAYQAGADAVKFSVFKPYQMTLDSSEAPFMIASGPWSGKRLYELYEQSPLRYEWIPELRRAAKSVGLQFIAAVYHPDTVEFLPKWGIRTVKVASFELGWHQLLKAIAAEPYIKRVILSAGSAREVEIAAALAILADKDVTLLYCVSAYPAASEELNLATLEDMKKFKVKVGLSDHTTGLTAPVMAVAMGATIIEKHIQLDADNLDSAFAVFPDRFRMMVEVCRQAETMLGTVSYDKPKTYHRRNVDGQMLRVVW